MESLSSLEQQVLAAMATTDREREVLEQQIAAARVVERDFSGVGFFTKLSVPDTAACLDRTRWKTQDMPQGFAHHPSLSAGASFILWIKDGRIATLEGFTNEGRWPDDEAGFRVAV